MGLQGPLLDRLASVLQVRATVGSLNFSLAGLALGMLTLWLTGRLARLSQYVLELDVFPRFQLERGVDYTLSTLIRYMILLVGVLFGLAAVGVDTTKFTIVAGELGGGIGFGLQNIVNNFVSGLILLFERPIKVGDLIQVNERVGMLKQVGLRASIMRRAEGAEVISTNGLFLSNEVTNWTLSDPLRRIQLDIGVAYGSKPREVTGTLRSSRNRNSVSTWQRYSRKLARLRNSGPAAANPKRNWAGWAASPFHAHQVVAAARRAEEWATPGASRDVHNCPRLQSHSP